MSSNCLSLPFNPLTPPRCSGEVLPADALNLSAHQQAQASNAQKLEMLAHAGLLPQGHISASVASAQVASPVTPRRSAPATPVALSGPTFHPSANGESPSGIARITQQMQAQEKQGSGRGALAANAGFASLLTATASASAQPGNGRNKPADIQVRTCESVWRRGDERKRGERD